MNSFEKLFVNSTNRFSAAKNNLLSRSQSNFSPLQLQENQLSGIFNHKQLSLIPNIYPQSNETIESLMQRYEELSNIVNEASQQKQMMTILFDKIFKVEQGQQEKLKKRIRRKKNELQSKFLCKIQNCNKIYSSSASLVRHTKLKHAYCTQKPPEHNYLIPPSPNLKGSQHTSIGSQSSSVLVSEEKDDEEGDALVIFTPQDQYEADCEESVN